jgi:hypothetical protein
MPMRLFKSVLFTLVALIVVGEMAIAAEPAEPAGPEWRHGYDNQWCFRMSYKEACLPAGFELTKFEPGHAWWHQWNEPGHVIQIKYEGYLPDYDDSILASQCLVLQSSFGTRHVQVTELATDTTEEDSHSVSILVAVFDERFSITLSGTELERMRAIAHSLAEEWSSIAQ